MGNEGRKEKEDASRESFKIVVHRLRECVAEMFRRSRVF